MVVFVLFFSMACFFCLFDFSDWMVGLRGFVWCVVDVCVLFVFLVGCFLFDFLFLFVFCLFPLLLLLVLFFVLGFALSLFCWFCCWWFV